MRPRDLATLEPEQRIQYLGRIWQCQICAAPIAADRAARAIARGHLPRYCKPPTEHYAASLPHPNASESGAITSEKRLA